MKKIFLSFSLIFGFAVYAEYQNNSPSSFKDSAMSSQTAEKPVSLNLDSAPSAATATDIPKDIPKQQPIMRSGGEENNDYESEGEGEGEGGDDREVQNIRPNQTASSRTSPPQTQTTQKSSAQSSQMMGMGSSMFSGLNSMMTQGIYKNGNYTGNIADAYYGNVQVKAVISSGKITDVQFLDYPNDRQNSIHINTYAMPILKSEAIKAQSAKVDVVSGATATSEAFQESLASALAQAKI